jgi:cation/acetate symporter
MIGFSAIVLLTTDPEFIWTQAVQAQGWPEHGGGQLSAAVGGNFLLGFISAVAFATILAVVSGLTLAGASAISHDLYANVFAHGNVDEQQEVRISKMATVALGIIAILLGIAFEKQNIAYLVGLTFCGGGQRQLPDPDHFDLLVEDDHQGRAARRLAGVWSAPPCS